MWLLNQGQSLKMRRPKDYQPVAGGGRSTRYAVITLVDMVCL